MKIKTMKRILTLAISLLSMSLFSQQELKLDIADALALKTLEISYEFYVNEKSSLGVAGLFNFEGRSSDFRYNEDRMITPFFRHYFSANGDWNFFGELFFGINTGEIEEDNNGVQTFTDYTDGALGIGIGTKYVSEGGLIIDAHAGLGRNLFGSDSPILVPRVGIGIGYRF